jgi:hypothetical protein
MLSIKFVQEGVASMRKIPVLAQLSILGMLCLVSAPWAHADTLTVNAYDNIYAAGIQSGLAPGPATSTNGVAPGSEAGQPISTAGVTAFTFSTSGVITLNFGGGSGTGFNDPDGITPFGDNPYPLTTSSNLGYGSISGITAPGAGYLVGVFIGPGGPSGPAPTALDFVTTSFTSLSPLLDQTFFIGDGLTGDGSGTAQTFVVPTGATELYLAISDACGYNGSPSCYGDNQGAFAVVETPQDGPISPEPSSFLLFGTGILGMAGMFRRKLLAR